MTKLPLLTALLLTAVLAGCSNPPSSDGSSSTSTTQEPAPVLQWVYVNRTLNITGERPPNNSQVGFVPGPDNANCVEFRHIGKAGLVAVEATAEGDNPDTVASWELLAEFPSAPSFMGRSVGGLLPLTLNSTGLEVEGQNELEVDLVPAQSQPALAFHSNATLAIRLAVLAPAELSIPDNLTTCT